MCLIYCILCDPAGLESVCGSSRGLGPSREAGVCALLSQPAGHWCSAARPRCYRLPVPPAQPERVQFLRHSSGTCWLVTYCNPVIWWLNLICTTSYLNSIEFQSVSGHFFSHCPQVLLLYGDSTIMARRGKYFNTLMYYVQCNWLYDMFLQFVN